MMLSNLYEVLDALQTESNRFQICFDNFQKSLECLKLTFDKDLIRRSTAQKVNALSDVTNDHQDLHEYEEAKKYYRKALVVWEDVSRNRAIYIINLSTCLRLQKKLDAVEEIVKIVILDRNDTSFFR